MAMASLHLGMPQCETNRDMLKGLNAMLQEAKGHWASFNSDTAKEVLVSGDAAAAMIYDGYNAKARAEGANVEYAFPTQGYIAWMDNVVLLKDAPNRDNALKFMDFLLEPENMAALTNWTQYSSGVEGVAPLLDEALRSLPEANPPASAGKPVFIEVCEEQVQAVYDKIWTGLKK
jgi:spermidine/putrescine transport system substrate-binding protein